MLHPEHSRKVLSSYASQGVCLSLTDILTGGGCTSRDSFALCAIRLQEESNPHVRSFAHIRASRKGRPRCLSGGMAKLFISQASTDSTRIPDAKQLKPLTGLI